MVTYPTQLTTGPMGTLTPVTGGLVKANPPWPAWVQTDSHGNPYAQNLQISGGFSIYAANFTLDNCEVICADAANPGMSLRAANITLTDCSVHAPDSASADRLGTAIEIFDGSSGTIQDSNVYWFRSGINFNGGCSNWTIQDNWVSDLVFQTSDHSEPIVFSGDDINEIVITGNSLL